MKNGIDLIIKLLVKLVILLFAVFIAFVSYVIVFSKQNNIEIDDTISYIKEIGTSITDKTNTVSKESINILLPESNTNNSNTNQIANKTLNYFYYNQLDDVAKNIYSSLNNNLDNLKNENFNIDFDTKFNSILNSTGGQEKI